MTVITTAKGVIFDLDGTLVDTKAQIQQIWQAWAASVDLTFNQVESFIHGRTIKQTLASVAAEFDTPKQEQQVQMLAQPFMAQAKACNGASAFVDRLNSIASLNWAIASSGTAKLINTSLNAAGLAKPSVIISSESVQFSKPDPQAFELAAKQLNLPAQACIAFEDSLVGVQAARAAGCFVIAINCSRDCAQAKLANLHVSHFGLLSIERQQDKLVLLHNV